MHSQHPKGNPRVTHWFTPGLPQGGRLVYREITPVVYSGQVELPALSVATPCAGPKKNKTLCDTWTPRGTMFTKHLPDYPSTLSDSRTAYVHRFSTPSAEGTGTPLLVSNWPESAPSVPHGRGQCPFQGVAKQSAQMQTHCRLDDRTPRRGSKRPTAFPVTRP